MIAMKSVCSLVLDIDPHDSSQHIQPAPNSNAYAADIISSATTTKSTTANTVATTTTTTTESSQTSPPSSIPPVINPTQPLFSALKRYNSCSPPTSPPRYDATALRPTRSASMNGRTRNVEFHLNDGNETLLSGQQQQQQQQSPQRRQQFETDKNDDIDDADTPVNVSQWGCGIDQGAFNAAMLMTSSSSNSNSATNKTATANNTSTKEQTTSDLFKPIPSQDSSNDNSSTGGHTNNDNGNDIGNGNGRRGVDLDPSPPSLDDSWSGSVVTALLSPRYLIPDLGNTTPLFIYTLRDIMTGLGNTSTHSIHPVCTPLVTPIGSNNSPRYRIPDLGNTMNPSQHTMLYPVCTPLEALSLSVYLSALPL